MFLYNRVPFEVNSNIECHRERDNNFFSVSEIPKENWHKISKIAQDWATIAGQKYLEIHGGRYPFFSTRDAYLTDKGKRMRDCDDLCRKISNSIDTGNVIEPWDTIITCTADEKIQSIALHDSTLNKLGFIVTHPKNIRHRINDLQPEQIRGAGTQIILYLASKTLRSNLNLRLTALESSKKFYDQLGFEEDFDNVDPYAGYFHTTSMKLTAEKIREKIKERTSPFNQLES